MIQQSTGAVFGMHRRKAVEAGTMWRIHWNNGQVSIAMPTDAAHIVVFGKMNEVVWMENMDMAPFLTQCIKALDNGLTMGADGLFISYIEWDTYEVVDPALGDDEDRYGELGIRRILQNYYTANPLEMEEDKAYIEDYIRELA